MRSDGVEVGRLRAFPFVVAGVAASTLILAGPFIGEIRRAILARFPGQFVRIVGVAVALAIGAALVAAFVRIRDRRAWRYTLIAVALAIAATYAFLSRTGDPQVDAVERFHFVEYGLVTLLFYRAWRPASDLSTFVLPLLAGLLVGTIEEWFQWFIPARVGDVRDVFLNGVAIVCGLLFSVAFDPPEPRRAALTRRSLRRIGAFAALWVLIFAAFFQSVEVGYAIGGDGWMFKSGYTAARLDASAADRAVRWRNTFVPRPPRLSAEDQYMTEGLWHVQRRNNAWSGGDVVSAWNENQILERYFAPVLDSSSYVSKTGHRWSADHRADAERRFLAARPLTSYESDAAPAPIHAWPRHLYWGVAVALALILALPGIIDRMRGRAFTLLIGLVIVLAATPGSAQTVDTLVARHIEARGGYDKLKAIQTITITRTVATAFAKVRVVIYKRRPYLYRVEQGLVQAGPPAVSRGISPDGAWDVAGGKVVNRSAEGFAEARDLDGDFDGLLVDWKEKGHVVTYEGKETLPPGEAHKLKVRTKGGAERLIYLDASSYLERRQTGVLNLPGGRQFDVVIDYGNYRDVAGVKFPYDITEERTGKEPVQSLAVYTESIAVNLPMDAALFAPLPPPKQRP